MDDLISRKVAIDALTRKMVSIPTAGEKDLMGDVNRIRAEDISVIRRLPSAQPEDKCGECDAWNQYKNYTRQPEIVRCKDCKYMTEHYDTDGNAPYWTCSEWDSGTDYDGFCHYAERRVDGV